MRLCSHWSILLVIATECSWLCKSKTAPTSLASAIYIPISDPMQVSELQLVCAWLQVTEQDVLRCEAYVLMYGLAGSDMPVDVCQSAEASKAPSSASPSSAVVVPPARQRVSATSSTPSPPNTPAGPGQTCGSFAHSSKKDCKQSQQTPPWLPAFAAQDCGAGGIHHKRCSCQKQERQTT